MFLSVLESHTKAALNKRTERRMYVQFLLYNPTLYLVTTRPKTRLSPPSH